MSSTQIHWLTQEAYDRLTAELQERETIVRPKISKAIELAREEGDLKENGGYHAAKDDQGRNEARIRELRHLVHTSQIGRPPEADSGVATHGSVVTVRFPDGAEDRMLLASREEKGHTDLEICSPTSPLGKALMGQPADSAISYDLPNGRSVQVHLVHVEN